tara:strand:+ start:829 stop:1158 length:330 start_codon:yes stop_codon:yes gene_type:complete
MALGNVRYESITVNGNIDIAYPGGIGTIDIRSADYDSASITFAISFDGGRNFRAQSATTYISAITAVTSGDPLLGIKVATPACVIRFITASKGGDVAKPVSIAVTATNT